MKHRRQRRGIDGALDALLPSELRHLSHTHWTPADVAVRAVALLAPARNSRVLDVGAGVGKVCTIGALSSCGTWCGVEQHGELVSVAQHLARTLGVADRTTFVHGDAFALDWDDYDALYLYNPFQLSLFGESVAAYRGQVARMERRLAALRDGVRVVTLHGFGGVMPPTFELVYQEHVPLINHDLVLWKQRASTQVTRERC